MRTMILAGALALAACGKPAEEKKAEPRTPAGSAAATAEPRPATPPPPSSDTPLGRPLTVEEKAKEASKIEAKLELVDSQAAKLAEDMKQATTATERDALVGKLEHLQQEKTELRKQLEQYR